MTPAGEATFIALWQQGASQQELMPWPGRRPGRPGPQPRQPRGEGAHPVRSSRPREHRGGLPYADGLYAPHRAQRKE
jgi:hypothetical protein